MGEARFWPGTSNPSTVFIDLAIKATEDGQKVIFYYRSGQRELIINWESTGWTQYATYTISGSAFHGYPINKDLLSLVASDLSYPPDAPLDNPINQGNDIVVQGSVSENITKESIQLD